MSTKQNTLTDEQKNNLIETNLKFYT